MNLADIFKSTRFRYSNRQVTKRPYNLLEGISLEKVPEKDNESPSGSKSKEKNETSLQTPAKPDSSSPAQTVETPPPADVSVTYIASTPKVGPQLAKRRRVADAEYLAQGGTNNSSGRRRRTDKQRSETYASSQSASTSSTIMTHSMSEECSTKAPTAVKTTEKQSTLTQGRGAAETRQKASTALKAAEKPLSTAVHSTPVSWRSRSATFARQTEKSILKEPEAVSSRRQLTSSHQSDSNGSTSKVLNEKTTDNALNKVSPIKRTGKQTAGKQTDTTKAGNKLSTLKSSLKQTTVKQTDKTNADKTSKKLSSVRSSDKESLVRTSSKTKSDNSTETSVIHSVKEITDRNINKQTSAGNKSKKAKSATSTFAEDRTVLTELQRSKTSNNSIQENSLPRSVSRELESSKTVKESVSRKTDVNVSTLKQGQAALVGKQRIDKRIAHQQRLMRKKRLLSESHDNSALNISTARYARSQQQQTLNEESLLVDQSGAHLEAFQKVARGQAARKTGQHREEGEEDEEDVIESDRTVMVLDRGDRRKRKDVLDIDVALSYITELIKLKSDQCKGMRDRKVLELLEKYIVQDLSTTVFRCQSLRQVQSKIKKHNMSIKEKQKQLFNLQKKRMELEWTCKPLADQQQSSDNMTKINTFIRDMQTMIAKC